MEFHWASWWYCLLFFMKVFWKAATMNYLWNPIQLCGDLITYSIRRMMQSEGFWGQVSRGRGQVFTVKCVAGHSKHSCKEQCILIARILLHFIIIRRECINLNQIWLGFYFDYSFPRHWREGLKLCLWSLVKNVYIVHKMGRLTASLGEKEENEMD